MRAGLISTPSVRIRTTSKSIRIGSVARREPDLFFAHFRYINILGESTVPETSEKMAVIGAGPVGLGMANALKAHGIPYDQFEADDDIGGNWHHGVYSTTHTISSRKVTQFPDYPMPEELSRLSEPGSGAVLFAGLCQTFWTV